MCIRDSPFAEILCGVAEQSLFGWPAWARRQFVGVVCCWWEPAVVGWLALGRGQSSGVKCVRGSFVKVVWSLVREGSLRESCPSGCELRTHRVLVGRFGEKAAFWSSVSQSGVTAAVFSCLVLPRTGYKAVFVSKSCLGRCAVIAVFWWRAFGKKAVFAIRGLVGELKP